MKIYNLVMDILIKYKIARNCDKLLIWYVWEYQIGHQMNYINKDTYLKLVSSETIRRTRQKIQAKYKELMADSEIINYRKEIQKQKGTHIFRQII